MPEVSTQGALASHLQSGAMKVPRARVLIDGKDVSARVTSILLVSHAGKAADSAQITITTAEAIPRAEIAPLPRLGSEMRVSLGYEPDQVFVGHYTVKAIAINGAPNILTLMGEEARPVRRAARAAATQSSEPAFTAAALQNLTSWSLGRGAPSLENSLRLGLAPDLLPGSIIAVTGVHPEWDGRYKAKQVAHHFDTSGGFTTDVVVAPNTSSRGASLGLR